MIRWCLEHEAPKSAYSDDCWDADWVPCRMVEALLIVKENGQWPLGARQQIGMRGLSANELLEAIASAAEKT